MRNCCVNNLFNSFLYEPLMLKDANSTGFWNWKRMKFHRIFKLPVFIASFLIPAKKWSEINWRLLILYAKSLFSMQSQWKLMPWTKKMFKIPANQWKCRDSLMYTKHHPCVRLGIFVFCMCVEVALKVIWIDGIKQ